MKILGIDPGIDITGFACLEIGKVSDFKLDNSVSLLTHGVITTKNTQVLEEKLKFIHSKLKKLILELQPDVVVVEDIYSHSIHPKTGLKMGHIKGVIELAVSQAGIRLYTLGSTRIKKALLGRGNAAKEQVAKMIENTFQIYGITNLHESDAVAAALAYLFTNNRHSFRV